MARVAAEHDAWWSVHDEDQAAEEDAQIMSERVRAQAAHDEAELEAWAREDNAVVASALEGDGDEADWHDDPELWEVEPPADPVPPPAILAAWAQEWEEEEDFKKAMDDEMEKSAARLCAMSETLPVRTDLSGFVAVIVGLLHACPRAARHAAHAITTLARRVPESSHFVELLLAKGGIFALVGMLRWSDDGAAVAATNAMACLISRAKTGDIAREVGANIELLVGWMRSPSAQIRTVQGATKAVAALVRSHAFGTSAAYFSQVGSLYLSGEWSVCTLVDALLTCVSRVDVGYTTRREAADALKALFDHLMCAVNRWHNAETNRLVNVACEDSLDAFRSGNGVAKLTALLRACEALGEAGTVPMLERQQTVTVCLSALRNVYQLVHTQVHIPGGVIALSQSHPTWHAAHVVHAGPYLDGTQ